MAEHLCTREIEKGETAVVEVVSLATGPPLEASAAFVPDEAFRLQFVSLDDSEWLIVDTRRPRTASSEGVWGDRVWFGSNCQAAHWLHCSTN